MALKWVKYHTKNCEICGELYEYDSRQTKAKYCSKKTT